MSPPYGWTAWGAGLQGGGYVTCGSLQPTHTNTDDHDDPSIGNPDNLSVCEGGESKGVPGNQGRVRISQCVWAQI